MVSIHTGVKNNVPVYTVVNKKGSRVISTEQFFDKGEAHSRAQQLVEDDNWNAMNR